MLTSLSLAADILSPLVATSIAMPVASTLDARVSVLVGGALIEGILPHSFFLQLGMGVHSMSPTRSCSPWPEGFMLESDGFFWDIATLSS